VLLLVAILYTAKYVMRQLLKRNINFKGKKVFITGASSGIGEQLAYKFSKLGATLILSARRVDELERVKKACANSASVEIFQLDLSNPQEVLDKATQFAAKIQILDVLVLNGGISSRDSFEKMSMGALSTIMNINFVSNVALTKAFLPLMRKKKSGQIVVTSSIQGLMPVALRTYYSASKHAVQGFFNSLRAEVYQDNIDITILCPYYVKTNLSVNSVCGNNEKFGKVDANFEKGIDADKCAQLYVESVYCKDYEVMIAPVFYKLLTKITRISSTALMYVLKKHYSQQELALKKAK